MATAGKFEDDIDLGSALHGSRSQAMHRLRVGIGGLFAMVLLVGFASTVIQQTRGSADQADTVAKTADPAVPANDALVDIGVAPELPAEDIVVPDLPRDQMVPANDPDEAGAPPAR